MSVVLRVRVRARVYGCLVAWVYLSVVLRVRVRVRVRARVRVYGCSGVLVCSVEGQS